MEKDSLLWNIKLLSCTNKEVGEALGITPEEAKELMSGRVKYIPFTPTQLRKALKQLM